MMAAYLELDELEASRIYHCQMCTGEKVVLCYRGHGNFSYPGGPYVLSKHMLSLEGDVRYAFKEAVMERYFAFEIGDETGYVVGVDTDEAAFDARCRNAIEIMVGADTTALGTVFAYSVNDAIDRIRRGHWEYSQKA